MGEIKDYLSTVQENGSIQMCIRDRGNTMDTEKENAQQREQDREQLTELGAATTKTSKGTIYTLTIIGQIEGHQVLPETVKSTKYEHVMPLLASIEAVSYTHLIGPARPKRKPTG